MVDLKLQFPAGFFDEEIRDGFFVTPERKKIWAVELDLLNEFIRVCKKHNIKYFVDGGTMLGAVRHGGFIPWDDDVDIIMTREEYQKLEQVAPKEFEFPYFWQTETTDPGSLRGHAQLRNSLTTGILCMEFRRKFKFNQGIFIDVFPMDYVPDNKQERQLFFNELFSQREKAKKYAYLTSRYRDEGEGIIRDIVHYVLSRITTSNKAYKDFEQLMMRYDTTPTNTVSKLFFKETLDNIVWQSKWFEQSVEFPFEMLSVSVPVCYDEIMTHFFGDWRTPVVQQSTHGGVIFDVDIPYQYYLQNNDIK